MATFELGVPKQQMEAFYKATGWNSEYRPESHPTIATCFRQGEFAAFQKLGAALENVLHGEQEYKYIKPLQADVTYHGKTFLNSRYEKTGKNGTMHFYVLQTDLHDTNGEKYIECVSTIIVRIPNGEAKQS